MPLQTIQLTYADGTSVNVLVTNRSQIQYIEFIDGYREMRAQDQIESTRIIGCRWQDKDALAKDFLGDCVWLPGNMVGGVQSNLSRFIPEQHPDYPYLWAQTCELMHGGGVPPLDTSDLAKALSSKVDYTAASMANPDTFGIQYNLAWFAIKYAPVTWDVYDDATTPQGVDQNGNALGELQRYVQKTYQFSARNLPLPATAYYFANSNPLQPVADALVKIFPQLTVTYLWKQIPYINAPAFGNTLGPVNSYLFDNYYPAGTLLMTGIDSRRSQTGAGTVCFDITLSMIYQATGWNNFYQKSAKGFNEVSVDGGSYPYPAAPGQHAYDDADFNQCFILLAA